ncbi:sensor histidine kinase [Candidatus Marinarcus aquaticus]|uniref:histidine kinase n=1 Tax=Candidatus Marinarcus aquaticus TaxID=2044504 RepID=A0A4Q0XPV4_9BACT|nr:HAMP domain-containing sensor histidine kinase [Candidatus Marinarcus aquaticus]RXJ57588.1 two-component sensor histidine kinase [Candidatus Marinarcus aquaticus]
MKYSKSIYKQFYQKLIFATSLFIITLSFIFYGYTKATIYEDIKDGLLSDAKLIYKVSKESKIETANFNVITLSDVNVDIVTIDNVKDIKYTNFKQDDDYYVQLIYPFDLSTNKFIKITRNINSSRKMLSKIFNNILLLSLGGFIMVILYAFTVSKTLLKPILQITEKLSKMNENFLTHIDKERLPIEFHPLANSINTLTNKIQNFVKFKKELFIGAAHELKTPLAVVKLKNEVTLMKKREPERYEETLKVTIKEINDMNKMISSILDMGRAEGAQFEKPIELDIVNFMQSKMNDYKLLANQKEIGLHFNSKVKSFITIIQPTLLTHILQNFIQNAIKFTPKGKHIHVKLYENEGTAVVEVMDEGIGIDEAIDLFAPFKRVGGEAGAGLGLFLAKNAADSLGASIDLKNRKDGVKGTVATLCLASNPTCKI